uniref:Potassium channel tetramerisation-type BTB domain-containing protein n=1 Tax=Lepisosteus oculatus TaxID=7918 RepID=W5MNP1_LEPOC
SWTVVAFTFKTIFESSGRPCFGASARRRLCAPRVAGKRRPERCSLVNVGGCFFSIPVSRLALFQESPLWRTTLVLNEDCRVFLDRDGCTFRHVHYYIHTAKLASSCISEINLLFEQAAFLQLTPLQQALDNLQSGKHLLRARPVEIQITERAALIYWKTRICNTRQVEPMRSPASTVNDAVPLGLVGTPLLDSDEEVHFCFLLLDLVRQHPGLVTQGSLLWLSEDIALFECGSQQFRFIGSDLCFAMK